LDALDVASNEDLVKSLWKNRYTGQVKLWLTKTLLGLRKQQAEFFKNAEYVPLNVEGEFSEFTFAFARHDGSKWLVAVIPLHLAELCNQQNAQDIFSVDWKDTHVVLPGRLKKLGEGALFPINIEARQKLLVKKIFELFPLTLLRFESADNEYQEPVRQNLQSKNREVLH
jgi:maltooligosyltrehalose synthase